MVNRKISLTTFTLPSVIQNGIHSWCSCLEGGQRWIYARDKLPSIVRKTFGQWIVFMCCTEVWIFTDFDGGLWNKDLKKQVKLVLKLDSVYVLIGFLTLYKRWESKSWPFKGLLSPKQSFPWSWSVIQRHGLTKKKRKRKKLFQALDCLYALIRILTLHKRWKTKCWAFKGSVSPKKYLP